MITNQINMVIELLDELQGVIRVYLILIEKLKLSLYDIYYLCLEVVISVNIDVVSKKNLYFILKTHLRQAKFISNWPLLRITTCRKEMHKNL